MGEVRQRPWPVVALRGARVLASELIRHLEVMVRDHGDMKVAVYSWGCGGHYNCDPDGIVEEITVTNDGRIRIEG